MFCTQCGNKLEDYMKFCPVCGAPTGDNVAAAVPGPGAGESPAVEPVPEVAPVPAPFALPEAAPISASFAVSEASPFAATSVLEAAAAAASSQETAPEASMVSSVETATTVAASEEAPAPTQENASVTTTVPEAAFAPETTAAPTPEATVDAGTEQQTAEAVDKKKEKKKGKSSHPIIGVFLSIFIVLLLTAGFTLMAVRFGVSEKNVTNLMEKVDINKVTLDIDGKGTVSLSKYLQSQTFSVYNRKVQLDKKDIEKITKAKFVKKFLAEKTSDFLRDALFGTGTGSLEADELEDFLIDHIDEINELIDESVPVSLRESDVKDLIKQCEKEGLFEKANLEVVMEENGQIFAIVHIVLSIWLPAVLIAVGVFFLILIFIIEKNKVVGLKYTGIDCMVVGSIISAVYLAMVIVGGNLVKDLILGENFWKAAISVFGKNILTFGLSILGFGLVCLIIYLIISAVQKAAEKKKQPAQA